MNHSIILNITFGDKPYYNGPNFLPIQAGGSRVNIQSDNEGDNISEKNPIYGELTAVYWAWKNLKNVDIIGMSHYRRYLMTTSGLTKTFYQTKWEDFLKKHYNAAYYEKDLKQYDMVFCKKWKFDGMSVRQQFLEHHPYPEDLDLTRNILGEFHPECVPFWDKFLNGNTGYFCCLYITHWKIFDDLCKWMFPMLFEIEKQLQYEKYDKYELRIIAFLYERLLNVYIQARHLKIKEYPFYMIVDGIVKPIWRQELGARIWNIVRRFKKPAYENMLHI